MSYTSPLTQPQQKVKPSLGWVGLGVGLIVLSIVVFIIMETLAFVTFVSDMQDVTVVEPGGRVTMQLDEIGYYVYSNDFSDTVVSVSGPGGRVLLLESYETNNFESDGLWWYTDYSFDIDTPGSYVVSNGGTGKVAIGPNDVGQLGRDSVIAFLVGTFLGIAGLILIIVILFRRKGSRKRIRQATGTYSGMPYNPAGGQIPPQYGARPAGTYGTPPPGPYGTPPPGPYGTPPPGPYGTPPPGQPGGQPTPPGAPPPSNWPGR